MRLPHGDAVIVQRRLQILHRQRVFAVLGHLRVLVLGRAVARGGCVAGARLAVLQCVVRHVRDELLGGDRNQPDAIEWG